MIKLINSIGGKLTLFIALIFLKKSSQTKTKLKLIVDRIDSNKEKLVFPEILVSSIVRIEDKRFYQHNGIDIYGIARAIYMNITRSKLEGASTIVQQFVRNTINERSITFKRKINEIVLASLIDKQYSKNEIMIAYLNTYNFGNTIGINSLCKNEFYVLATLTEFEIAQITARFKYPNLNKLNYTRYLKRVRVIEINNYT
jgi:membrane carboxypeptidase/penicillin-binding protein